MGDVLLERFQITDEPMSFTFAKTLFYLETEFTSNFHFIKYIATNPEYILILNILAPNREYILYFWRPIIYGTFWCPIAYKYCTFFWLLIAVIWDIYNEN